MLGPDSAFASVLRTANASSPSRAHKRHNLLSTPISSLDPRKTIRIGIIRKCGNPPLEKCFFSPILVFMMNRINFESVEKLNCQRLVRFFCSLFFVTGLALLGGGCVSPDFVHDSYYARHPSQNGHNYRDYPYPYQGSRGSYGVPYYHQGGGNQFQIPRSHGGGHNPFHVPAGRYHNMGNPGKWRL